MSFWLNSNTHSCQRWAQTAKLPLPSGPPFFSSVRIVIPFDSDRSISFLYDLLSRFLSWSSLDLSSDSSAFLISCLPCYHVFLLTCFQNHQHPAYSVFYLLLYHNLFIWAQSQHCLALLTSCLPFYDLLAQVPYHHNQCLIFFLLFYFEFLLTDVQGHHLHNFII